jgi:hypothetical protein
MLSEMEFDVKYYDPVYRLGFDFINSLSHENIRDIRDGNNSCEKDQYILFDR